MAALADLDANPPPEQRPRIPQALVVRVLLETGARWGELTAATWADVDIPGARLVFRAENTKTGAERCIPLRRQTVEALEAYRLECAAILRVMPPAGAPVFLSPQGRPWTSGSNFRKVLRAAYERAGLMERDARGRLRSKDGHALHVHTLRHTFCTRLLAAGVPVPVVQAMLGHASPQMTLRVYTHLQAESARHWIEGAASFAGPGVVPGMRTAGRA
ncbi:MAG: site-specific integrase [Rhodospirillaceae bacterium]